METKDLFMHFVTVVWASKHWSTTVHYVIILLVYKKDTIISSH
jgi:hypothetical protein